MQDFQKRLANAGNCASMGGNTGAAIGGGIVSAVCALGGQTVGPVGTFFGAQVGQGAGAAIGGTVGSVLGAVFGFIWC